MKLMTHVQILDKTDCVHFALISFKQLFVSMIKFLTLPCGGSLEYII